MSPDVETSAFVLRLRPGTEAEYRRRHDALWPEMRTALLEAGILRYDIHLHRPTGMLFAQILRVPGSAPTAAGIAVMARWRAFMADILVMDGEHPVREPLEPQFLLVAE